VRKREVKTEKDQMSGYDNVDLIPALGRLRQKNYEFQASLGYIDCLKKKKNPKKKK
jgi:hypothetical protein